MSIPVITKIMLFKQYFEIPRYYIFNLHISGMIVIWNYMHWLQSGIIMYSFEKEKRGENFFFFIYNNKNVLLKRKMFDPNILIEKKKKTEKKWKKISIDTLQNERKQNKFWSIIINHFINFNENKKRENTHKNITNSIISQSVNLNIKLLFL